MPRGAAPAVDQELSWLTVILVVLVQAERHDPAESEHRRVAADPSPVDRSRHG